MWVFERLWNPQIKVMRLRWFGHMERIEDTRTVKRVDLGSQGRGEEMVAEHDKEFEGCGCIEVTCQ